MRFFLKIKAWQLFLYFAACCLAANLLQAKPHAAAMVFRLISWGYIAWAWTVGIALSKSIPADFRIKTVFFNAGASYFILCALILIDPFSMIIMGTPAYLYMQYFVSRNLEQAERQKPVGFVDYAGSFFLLYTFPIGLWIIQPRINRLFLPPLAPANPASVPPAPRP